MTGPGRDAGRRRSTRAAVALALWTLASLGGAAAAAVVGTAGPARADTAYRYWAYYLAENGRWVYAQRGPAAEHPVNGEVQGWRFGVQGAVDTPLTPRVPPSQLTCPSPTAPDLISVGIVIDFGTPSDAPPGETPPARVITKCVTVRQGQTGADVLVAAVGQDNVRIGSSGLICGIDGYPRSECAPAVSVSRSPVAAGTTSASASAAPPSRTPSTGTAASTVPAATAPPTEGSRPQQSTPSEALPATGASGGAQPSATSDPSTTPSVPTTAAHPATAHTGGVDPATVIAGAAAVLLGSAGAWTAINRRRGNR